VMGSADGVSTSEFGLPEGLDGAVLRALANHQGRGKAISRRELCARVQAYGASERQVREQIRQLRRRGHLIGSAGGAKGGYYLITEPGEFQEFLRVEFQAKIEDMRQTAAAMAREARKRWGTESMQMRLF